MSKIENAWMQLLDIRICLIRKDFDPEQYERQLMIGGGFLEAYCTKDGEPLPDYAYDSACLKIVGFDEPFDGYAYNLVVSEPDGERVVASDTIKANRKKFFDEIKSKFILHVHSSKSVTNAFDKIINAAWGFDCDADEIQDEAISKIKGVKSAAAFYGTDLIDTEDVNFAGGLFCEVTPYEMQLCSIDEDGVIAIKDERDPEEVRMESGRFVFALSDE
jgi:hypothetical protein